MKNKFIFFLTICLFININYYNIKAEEFIFESPVIEITNSGNKIQAKNGVKVYTKNNIEITANESTYDKIKLVLSLLGNIKVIDRENNRLDGRTKAYREHRRKLESARLKKQEQKKNSKFTESVTNRMKSFGVEKHLEES